MEAAEGMISRISFGHATFICLFLWFYMRLTIQELEALKIMPLIFPCVLASQRLKQTKMFNHRF
jgi:hypothetical protein